MNLSRDVTILDAASLTSAMRQAAATGATLHINASAVERIDTAILQLLCVVQQSPCGSHIELPSQPFLEAVHRCGLERVLLHHRPEAA